MSEVDGQWCFCRLCSPQVGDEERDVCSDLRYLYGDGFAVLFSVGAPRPSAVTA